MSDLKGIEYKRFEDIKHIREDGSEYWSARAVSYTHLDVYKRQVTDPKGTIIVECGKMLVNGGYRIKVLNTINFKKSMHYNPFHYIRSEKDILKLVNTIIANTKGEGEKSTEDFWVSATRSQAVKSLRTLLVY